jgi:tRNA(Ile)-lysidine synthase
LAQRVLARARAAGFNSGDRLVVGFSGGRDSLALAAALRQAGTALGIEPTLVHVDHRLRPSSGDEAARARQLAVALDLPFQTIPVQEPLSATHPGVGVEEAARRERYRMLRETAIAQDARAVATGHHQEDQAETVLLHLLRGGGVHGAAGMAERAPLPVSANQPSPRDISQELCQPWLWRPFLSEPRAVIDDYVRRLGLDPIEDPSNQDVSLRRNALRHQVMPLLEEHFPGAAAALNRYSCLAAEDDRVLQQIADELLARATEPGRELAVAVLREQPLALRRRAVRTWLMRTTEVSAVTANRVEAVLQLAEAGRGGSVVEIGEGWTVRLGRGMLHAERPDAGGRAGTR